jgi:Ca-activated chloride channel family protein
LIEAGDAKGTVPRPLRIAGIDIFPRCEWMLAFRTRRKILPIAVFLSLCGFSPPALRAQNSVPVSQAPLVAATEIVKIDASILDNQGNFVGGLSRSNFRVLDNGAPQPIVVFTPLEAPAQILVMIETSPAVYLIHDQHVVAAYALLDGLAPDDQVALVTYDESPHAALPFTSDKRAFLAALNGMQFTIGMGDLNFYDSVSSVLGSLDPAAGKRSLVVLTTGLDSSPAARWDALVQKLRSEDVVIFAVALGGALRGEPAKNKKPKNPASPQSAADAQFAKADQALRSLAEITGGRAYFPQSAKDFVPIYHEIASALRHEYVLGIAPQHDGQFHKLIVEPLDTSGQPMNAAAKKPVVRVFAREGYLAPAPAP